MPRLGLEDMPNAGLIRSDQFLMFAILFMACMMGHLMDDSGGETRSQPE